MKKLNIIEILWVFSAIVMLAFFFSLNGEKLLNKQITGLLSLLFVSVSITISKLKSREIMKGTLALFILITSLLSTSCKKDEVKIETEKNTIEKTISKMSSKKVLIIKTLSTNECTKFSDMFGNKLKPRTYYYWSLGRLIQKQFSIGASMHNTEADFLLTYKKIEKQMPITSYSSNAPIFLKVEVFNYFRDPSSMMIK